MANNFGDAVEKNLEAMGMNGKGVLSQMEKTPPQSKQGQRRVCQRRDLQAQGVEFPIHLDLSNFFDLYGRNQTSPILQTVDWNYIEQKILSLIWIWLLEDDLQRDLLCWKCFPTRLGSVNTISGDQTIRDPFMSTSPVVNLVKCQFLLWSDVGTDNAAAKAAGFDEANQLIGRRSKKPQMNKR